MFNLTKVAGKLMKCLNPLNNLFSLFGKLEGKGWGEGSKCSPKPKLQEI